MRSKHVTLLEAALPFLLVVASASATTTTATATGSCPDGCNGRGDCIKGICVCSRPFTGTACEGEGDLGASAETIDAVGGFPEPASSSSSSSSSSGDDDDDSSAAAGATITTTTTTARRDDDDDDDRADVYGYGSNHGDGAESGGVAAGGVPKTLTICLVTAEVVGPVSNGGIGTAMTTLAHTLTAAGHKVTILFTMGPVSQYGPFESWVENSRTGIEPHRVMAPRIEIHRDISESYECTASFATATSTSCTSTTTRARGTTHCWPRRGTRDARPSSPSSAYTDLTNGPKRRATRKPSIAVGDLEMDYMERRSVAMADHVVSPSRYLLGWMARQGWPTNSASVVQPNVLPLADRRSPSLGPRPEGPHPALLLTNSCSLPGLRRARESSRSMTPSNVC